MEYIYPGFINTNLLKSPCSKAILLPTLWQEAKVNGPLPHNWTNLSGPNRNHLYDSNLIDIILLTTAINFLSLMPHNFLLYIKESLQLVFLTVMWYKAICKIIFKYEVTYSCLVVIDTKPISVFCCMI